MRLAGLLVFGALTLGSVASAAETITYTYDALGRLVRVAHSDGQSSGTQVDYTHDAAGNRTRVQVSGAPH